MYIHNNNDNPEERSRFMVTRACVSSWRLNSRIEEWLKVLAPLTQLHPKATSNFQNAPP